MIAPSFAELTNLAYLERYPFVILVPVLPALHAPFNLILCQTDTETPARDIDNYHIAVFDNSQGPSLHCLRDMCPIHGPSCPGKPPVRYQCNRLAQSIPAMAEVGDSISLIPGPPLGPS